MGDHGQVVMFVLVWTLLLNFAASVGGWLGLTFIFAATVFLVLLAWEELSNSRRKRKEIEKLKKDVEKLKQKLDD